MRTSLHWTRTDFPKIMWKSFTLVDLKHRLPENMSDQALAARKTFESPGGWAGLLAAYATKAV